MAPRDGKSCGLPKQTPPRWTSQAGKTILFTWEKSPPELPRAIWQSTLKGCVGALKDVSVRNVPLPWVPRIQSAKLITPSRCSQMGTPLHDYLPLFGWIPMLSKLGSILRFSQRILWSFPPIAIKAKNNLLFSAHGFVKSLEQSTPNSC